MSPFEVCELGGEGVETKERKGEGRRRLSPGKKMAPLGPCWARLPATQGTERALPARLLARLPAMLVAVLPTPPKTQLQREGSSGCSCHVSPSNS